MDKLNRKTLLFLSLIFDAIGYISFTIPVFGEFTDVIWAPLSSYLMLKMYKGNLGKTAAAISFVEEGLPFLDVIPTFTIVWIYKNTFGKDKKSKEYELE